MMRLYPDPPGQLARWSRRFLQNIAKVDAIHVLTAMTHGIRESFQYTPRRWGPPQTPTETIERGSGTCRDFAVLMMEAARSLGLAVRFVSGYLFVPCKPGEAARHGGGSTHAWVRAFLPSGGWVEFDPTNGLVGNRDLIRVAVVRDPFQALTLAGSWEGESKEYLGMDVEIEVDSTSSEVLAAAE